MDSLQNCLPASFWDEPQNHCKSSPGRWAQTIGALRPKGRRGSRSGQRTTRGSKAQRTFIIITHGMINKTSTNTMGNAIKNTRPGVYHGLK